MCARHLDRAEATTREFQAARAYDDWQEMLRREELHAVFVIAPEQQQAAIVSEVLRAGVPVFVEKPLGLTADEAQTVADLATQVGKQVMVGFMKRFAPAYGEMKRIMHEQESFGEPLSLFGMSAIGSREGWVDEWFIKTGGIHCVDLARYLFGEVEEVHGL